MDKVDADLPADLLAGLLMEQARPDARRHRQPDRLTAKIYAVMAVTTMLTFGTLATGYHLLFTHNLFA